MAEDYVHLYRKLMRLALTQGEAATQAIPSEPIDLGFS
jgi:hypothetical protein